MNFKYVNKKIDSDKMCMENSNYLNHSIHDKVQEKMQKI